MFRFRLQPVLDLREQRERDLAAQLAQAHRAEYEAQRRLELLRENRSVTAAQIVSGPADGSTPGRAVGELAAMALLFEHLDGQIKHANSIVDAANANVSQAQLAFSDAHRDRSVLDRLRDRQAEEFRVTEEQRDRSAMDAVALTRYIQGAPR